jgi:hypothetical protein
VPQSNLAIRNIQQDDTTNVKNFKNPHTFLNKLFIAEEQTEGGMDMMNVFRNFVTPLQMQQKFKEGLRKVWT